MISNKRTFPKWIFAVIAIGALFSSGIFTGILSIEGFTNLRFLQTLGFGLLGLIMFWGTQSKK
ncbi:MAG: hypothetical protein JEZ06_09290 [Anaerolineaceae bacterium]|nr:hypothetical protein [Anaerolineaceae bacterium]